MGYSAEDKALDAETLRKYIYGGHVSEYMENLQVRVLYGPSFYWVNSQWAVRSDGVLSRRRLSRRRHLLVDRYWRHCKGSV